MDAEAVESTDVIEEQSPLDMSDEDFAAIEGNSPVVADLEDSGEAAGDEGEQENEQEENLDNDDIAATSTDDEDDSSSDPDDGDNSSDDSDVADPHSENGTEQSLETNQDSDNTEVDYEAEYKRLMTPFKANGKDMAIKNIDDAIQLMQMGAGYNRKMAALKPNMAILKMLEKNELLSEEKLSFLIDINKKDPAAIARLVKESGLEPLEMDLETDEYTPTSYAVNTAELDLDNVIEEIRDTPTFSKTLSTVDAWDTTSKQAVANDPNLLRVINAQVDSGIYDLVSTAVESERMYGRLQGLSDIQAYQTVGDAIQNRGGFDHLFEQGQQSQPAIKAQPKKGTDQGRKDKRRKASPTKQSTPAKASTSYDPLAMSDEEFLKQGDSKFL